MQQPKLNQKHAKWVEYLHNFTFVLKHISGQANKIANGFEHKDFDNARESDPIYGI